MQGKFLGPPQGPLYVATDLANRDIPVRIYDTAKDISPSEFTPERLGEYLAQIPEGIIGLSLWDSVAPKVVLAVDYLKQRDQQKVVILGGPSASSIGFDLVEQFPSIDFAVSGEGEGSLYGLLSWIEKGKGDCGDLSAQVFGRRKGKIVRGAMMTTALKAEDIPTPNYSLVNRSRYNKAEIVTTRGCPFTCEFCSVNNAWGGRTRFRRFDHISRELESLFVDSSFDCVHVLDDTFGINKRRLVEFCDTFRSSYPEKQWSCYFRVDDMDREMIDFMSRSGCLGLYVGVETGSEELLSSFGKGLGRKEIIERIKYASTQMNVTASFIWGLPDEGFDGFTSTLEFIDDILEFEQVFVNLYQLSPLSGTEVKRKLEGKLVFDPNTVSGFIYPPYVAKLTLEEQNLIRENPNLFSAFYREDTKSFEQKYDIVKEFISNTTQESETTP